MDAGKREPLDPIETAADREALARRVAELTRERDAAIVDAEAEQQRIAVLMQQREHLASEIFVWRRRHAREAEQLAEALAAIREMRRSRFWQLRDVWVRIHSLNPFLRHRPPP